MLDIVKIVNDQPMADSRDIAEHFGKEHKDVLKAIRNLDCSEEFARLNFQPSEYTSSRGKVYPHYLLTRDGLTFLVMGFTGRSAAQWKEQFIATQTLKG